MIVSIHSWIEGISFGSRMGTFSVLEVFSVLEGFLFSLTVIISLFSLRSEVDTLDNVEALVAVMEVYDVDISFTVLLASSVLDGFSFSLPVNISLVLDAEARDRAANNLLLALCLSR